MKWFLRRVAPFVGLFILSLEVLCQYNFYNSDSLFPIVHSRKNHFSGGGVWDRLYMQRPQKLNNNRLNLNAWGGFHELEFDHLFKDKELEVDFLFGLSDQSYLYYYIDKSNEEKQYGIRLSNNSLYPSLYFIRNAKGKFLKKQYIDLKLSSDEHEMKIKYLNYNKISISIDDVNLHLDDDFSVALGNGVMIGWGGSDEHTPVWIDDLKITNNKNYLLENKFTPSLYNFTKRQICTLILFYLFLFIIDLKINNEQKRWSIQLYIFIIIALAYTTIKFSLPSRYFDEEPGFTEEKVNDTFNDLIKKNLKELKQSTSKKIFFYGGSKTYGDGARNNNETWVKLITDFIFVHFKNKFLIFNWGIPSANSTDILHFNEKLLSYRPVLIVLALNVNDYDVDTLTNNVQKILNSNKKNNITTLILEESTYINNAQEFNSNNAYKNYSRLLNLCDNKLVYCVKTRNQLYTSNNFYDSGILWVEWVHSTSWGHQVFADLIKFQIFEALAKIEN